MLTLALVTCGPQLETAVAGDSVRGCSTVRLCGSSRRSSLILAAVDLLLEDAGGEPTDISAVVVSRGPGSFTGIRSGLATAVGLARGIDRPVVAYDSLLMQATRVEHEGLVWAAQPGRRGEVYARRYEVGAGRLPVPAGDLQIVAVSAISSSEQWVAPSTMALGSAQRAAVACGAAEALLRLLRAGHPGQPVQPLYVEDPPIHRAGIELPAGG